MSQDIWCRGFRQAFPHSELVLCAARHEVLDITDDAAVEKLVKRVAPDACVCIWPPSLRYRLHARVRNTRGGSICTERYRWRDQF